MVLWSRFGAQDRASWKASSTRSVLLLSRSDGRGRRSCRGCWCNSCLRCGAGFGQGILGGLGGVCRFFGYSGNATAVGFVNLAIGFNLFRHDPGASRCFGFARCLVLALANDDCGLGRRGRGLGSGCCRGRWCCGFDGRRYGRGYLWSRWCYRRSGCCLCQRGNGKHSKRAGKSRNAHSPSGSFHHGSRLQWLIPRDDVYTRIPVENRAVQ